MTSHFQVRIKQIPGEFGAAIMNGDDVSFTPYAEGKQQLEKMGLLSQMAIRTKIYELCRSTGHTSKFSITECTETGIIVERL